MKNVVSTLLFLFIGPLFLIGAFVGIVWEALAAGFKYGQDNMPGWL